MAEIIKTRVTIADLKPGMYVCELDRPWLGTPFLLQGFTIDNEQDIETLAQFCEHVYIDERRSWISAEHLSHRINISRGKNAPPAKKSSPYQDKTEWRNELHDAKPMMDRLQQTIQSTLQSIVANKSYDLTKLRYVVDPLVDSVIRNPDASIWLLRLRDQDDYQYKHALGVAVWVTALGRQIGLPRDELAHLAFGGVLLDIGKLKLPTALLQKTGTLNRSEYEQVKQHVQLSVELMQSHGGIAQEVRDMVQFHHERFDGTGYPHGRNGTEIPLFARMAAIADSYDAMTSRRYHATALSPSEAVSRLYLARDVLYQAELIEEFIQAIGIFPAGTMVELSDGRVAVVVSEYRTRRLRPTVLVLLDEDKQPLARPVILNLMETRSDKLGKSLHISRSLEPGAYDLHPDQLYRYDMY